MKADGELPADAVSQNTRTTAAAPVVDIKQLFISVMEGLTDDDLAREGSISSISDSSRESLDDNLEDDA